MGLDFHSVLVVGFDFCFATSLTGVELLVLAHGEGSGFAVDGSVVQDQVTGAERVFHQGVDDDPFTFDFDQVAFAQGLG